MQERKVRQEVYRLFRNVGYWPVRGRDTIVCARCGNAMHPPIGRPDIIVLAPRGLNCVVEVKVNNMEKSKSFALEEIRDEQRRWLTAWMEEGGLGYLALGTVNVRPRQLWLIPWNAWMDMEDRLHAEYKKSIPINLKTYSRLPSLQMDVVNRFVKYELEWIEGQWFLPADHELRRRVDVTGET